MKFTKPSQIRISLAAMIGWAAVLSLGLAIDHHCAGQETAASAQQSAPTKAKMISDLKQIFELMEKKQFEPASEFFLLPPNFKPEMLDGFIDRQEISLSGIQRLEKEAKFGSAIEVFGPQRGKYFADKAGTDPAKCFGFNHEVGGTAAEVLAIWNGSKFTFIRIDDVGKLPAIGEEPAEPMAEEGKSEPQPPSLDELSQQLPKLKANAEAAPNDVAALAQYAMALYRLGNVPEAWTQLRAAYQVEPAHSGIQRGIETVFKNLEKRGVFGVGVPSETISGILGEPDRQIELTGRTRYAYAFYGIDFQNDRIHEVVDLRGATNALFLPTETITVNLDGRGWRCGMRKKAQKNSSASFFLPGESASEWTEQVEIERILGAAAIGTCEKIAELLIGQIKQVQPKAQAKILESTEDSIILTTMIPGIGPEPTRYQLIRLMKGPQDLHRLAITIKTGEPTQAFQQRWLEIFKAAKLEPTKLPGSDE